MLNTAMENENKIFTNILIFSKIMIADHVYVTRISEKRSI